MKWRVWMMPLDSGDDATVDIEVEFDLGEGGG